MAIGKRKKTKSARALPSYTLHYRAGTLKALEEANKEIEELKNHIAVLQATNKAHVETIEEYRRFDQPVKPMIFEYKNPIPRDDNREQFSTGAVRGKRFEECRIDLVPIEPIEGYGDRLYLGNAVRKYPARNWEKGIPYANLLQHALTHILFLQSQIVDTDAYDLTQPFGRIQEYNTIPGQVIDTPYGNACGAAWNINTIITFMRRGNPAEEKP